MARLPDTEPRHAHVTLDDGPALITINRHCRFCHGYTTVVCDRDHWYEWKKGTLIQRVWPLATNDTRETLITGTHPECWDAMFNDEEGDI